MIKTYILIGIILLLSFGLLDYHSINIKMLSYKLNESEALTFLDTYPLIYYKGIRMIEFYDSGVCINYFNWQGRMFWQPYGIIQLCTYSPEILAHELAHQMQYNNKERLFDALNHIGNFSIYKQVIEDTNTYENISN